MFSPAEVGEPGYSSHDSPPDWTKCCHNSPVQTILADIRRPRPACSQLTWQLGLVSYHYSTRTGLEERRGGYYKWRENNNQIISSPAIFVLNRNYRAEFWNNPSSRQVLSNYKTTSTHWNAQFSYLLSLFPLQPKELL